MSRSLPLIAALGVCAFATAALADETSSDAAAVLERFQTATGEEYFALSLKPDLPAPVATAHRIAILVDTSASQSGEFRTRTTEVLKRLLSQLAPSDRVQLLAVDVEASPLTTAFVPPRGNDIDKALAQLTRRVPLGSTDMGAALTAASDLLTAGREPGVIVYLGDGVSKTTRLNSRRMQELTARLVKNRLPVNCFAIGPQVDGQLLAALANQTGGMVFFDPASAGKPVEANLTKRVGQSLAHAVWANVYWPISVNYGETVAVAYPSPLPPLRSDRDTVVIGTSKLAGPFRVTAQVEVSGQRKTLDWTVEPRPANADNAFLAKLVTDAASDRGASLPTAGSSGLLEVRRMMRGSAHQLARLGGQAVVVGDVATAQTLARRANQLDPTSSNVRAVNAVVAKQARGELRLAQNPAADNNSGNSLLATTPLLDEVVIDRAVIEGSLRREVQLALTEASRLASTDPDAGIDLVKHLLNRVSSTELDPGFRQQMRGRLERALRGLQSQRFEVIQRLQAEQEALASAEDRQRLLGQLKAKEDRIDQLMQRMNSLIEEGRYGDAYNTVELAQEEDPGNPAIKLARDQGLLRGNLATMMRIRDLRWKGFYDSLESAEWSSIPNPDDPPVLYPDPQVWQELTARRKEYASVDLSQKGEAEKRILRELDKPTELEFIDTPLRDVLAYLEDVHHIQIEIDQKSLDDVGVASDEPITRDLKGVSLRSALRLVLRDLDLTYVIEDEVLLITTLEQAETKLVTKVYPVADLVIPVTTPNFSGGFGGLGGMGGMGGQGGMGGLGGFGQGGGGGGMGGGGGGGGFGGGAF